jgi:glutamine synthetase
MGISVTFMAKVDASQAGSSCHLHLSLWRDGRNAFAGSQTLGPIQVSDTFRYFLGGWMHHLPALMAFYAPTVNSYKRFQAGSWAPTRIAWSHDNRTAGFRVVGRDQSLRIEARVPGADCNPYMAFAAALFSGLDGIANQIEPPPIFTGDVYAAQNLPHVPPTLRHAIANLKSSAFARRMLGDAVLNHYVRFFEVEQISYDKAVTDWERKRYFERI